MKLLFAFLRLIRSINLLFIALTQWLFYQCILLPAYEQAGISPMLSDSLFWLLVFSSVLIAAAGYIINDYFDLQIDEVNKPDRVIVGKAIRRRSAIFWHWTFSFAGILLGVYIGWKLQLYLWLALANTLCVIALWFYSTTFKRKILIGNTVISLLTAWVVLVVVFAESAILWNNEVRPATLRIDKLLRLSFLYAGFAFIISLIREIIKDMEDMPGDAKYNCRTMPIVWGLNVSKIFATTWMIVLMGALAILQIYVLQFPWWWASIYCLIFILAPLLYIMRKLFVAISSYHFHVLSNAVKFVMLTGILSMVFFKLYAFDQ